MDRRLVTATALLVLALLTLLFVEAGAALDADRTAAPTPAAATSTGDPAGVALPAPSPVLPPGLAGGSMSGDFAGTHLASLGAGAAQAGAILTPQGRARSS